MKSAKCIFTAAFLGMIATPALSQNPHQIGVNASVFIKQFVTFNNFQLQEINPYLITYRHFGKKFNFRTAIGGKFKYDNNDDANNRTYSETDIKSLNYRVGIEKSVVIAPKWNLYYGVDLVTFQSKEVIYSRYTSSSGFTNYTNTDRREWLYGLAPNLGFEWKLNARVSLYSEAYIQTYRRKLTEKIVKYSTFTPAGPAVKNVFNTGNLSITMPVSLFVLFRL